MYASKKGFSLENISLSLKKQIVNIYSKNQVLLRRNAKVREEVLDFRIFNQGIFMDF